MGLPVQRRGYRRQTTQEAFGPPITEEERNANLNALEHQLNREVNCPGGKNHVYIRSLLTGNGTTTPRIALKCQLRKDIGEHPDVFYEYIRDICCRNPKQCEAYREFLKRLENI